MGWKADVRLTYNETNVARRVPIMILGTVSAILLAQMPTTAALRPEAIVREFLSLALDVPDMAAELLAPDAAIVAGDVGRPLTVMN